MFALFKNLKRRKNESRNKVVDNYSPETAMKAMGTYHMTYSEYARLASNCEIWFDYKDAEYWIYPNGGDCITMYITKYDGDQILSEESINFKTSRDLLANFKIEGKTIEEIWKDIEFIGM